MAKTFPFANDGLPLGFAFLVELIDILDRSPVCDVPHLTLPEKTVQHAAAGQLTSSAQDGGFLGSKQQDEFVGKSLVLYHPTNNSQVDAYASGLTQMVIDISSDFAPQGAALVI